MKRFTTSLIVSLLFGCASFSLCLAGGNGPSSGPAAIPVSVSEDGQYVLVTSASYSGLCLVNAYTGAIETITQGANSGYYATISPGNRYVCYKAFKSDGGQLLQAPMLYDVAGKKNLACADWSPLSGTPAVSADGKIAFTVGDSLFVESADLKALSSFDLAHHANLLAFSPDGSQIAFNSADDQMVILDLSTGSVRTVTGGPDGYWGPAFSPSGDKLLASTFGAGVVSVDLSYGGVSSLGKGQSAAWVDNDTVAFVKKTVEENEVIRTDLVSVDSKGDPKASVILDAGDAAATVRGKNLASSASGKVKVGLLDKGQAKWVREMDSPQSLGGVDQGSIAPMDVIQNGNVVEITGVPYIHQCWDTLDTFCGDWACGATSAMMALQYYNILPPNPRLVTSQYPHISNFGFYISEIYTFNGHTYNIGCPTSCRRQTGYGGYGYIVQNNWEDTKTHMAEYISYHGPQSSVDWSPTVASVQAEINAGHPFVLLNSLTSAGHYICCIGYVTNQNTLAFNDPYGNKNLGTYPNYSGTRVFYDWPGYNYGNQNLVTVWCYIYCRSTVGPPPAPFPDAFVNDIAMTSGHSGTSYYANAAVWVKNQSGGNVSGAYVTGQWSGAVSGSASGTTGSDGKITFQSPSKRNGGTFTFTVTNVLAPGYNYNSSLNVKTSASITAP